MIINIIKYNSLKLIFIIDIYLLIKIISAIDFINSGTNQKNIWVFINCNIEITHIRFEKYKNGNIIFTSVGVDKL